MVGLIKMNSTDNEAAGVFAGSCKGRERDNKSAHKGGKKLGFLESIYIYIYIDFDCIYPASI